MGEDLLGIVSKYHSLAKSYSNSAPRIEDETLFPFLAFCLSSDEANLEVIDLAIDTLTLLAKNDGNVSKMKRTFGVFEAVNLIASRGGLPKSIKVKAIELMRKRECEEYPAYCTRSKTKLQRPTKTFNLHVHGLNKDCEREVSSALLGVAGVVSIVLDQEHQRCCVLSYLEAKPADVAAALLDKTGLTAQLVSKNRFGQEILVALLEDQDSSISLPPYLNEVESPVKEKAVSQPFIKKESTNWLNSLVEVFQKSFYW